MPCGTPETYDMTRTFLHTAASNMTAHHGHVHHGVRLPDDLG
ncbi:MAG: hypothetical protein ACPGQT_09890 [Rhodothermales bacterium]